MIDMFEFSQRQMIEEKPRSNKYLKIFISLLKRTIIIPMVENIAVSHLNKLSFSRERHHGWYPLFHSNR